MLRLLGTQVRMKEAVFSATDRFEQLTVGTVTSVNCAPDGYFVDVRSPNGVVIRGIAVRKVEEWLPYPGPDCRSPHPR